MFDLHEVKLRAKGQEIQILTALADIPPEKLNGKGHPCPWCGGTNRFSLVNKTAGAVLCRKCFYTKNGDFLAAIMHSRKCTLPEAIELTAEWLGMAPQQSTAPRTPIDLIQKLATLKGTTRTGLAEYGAEVDGETVTFPVYGPDRLQCSTFTIWPTAPKGDKRLTGLLAKGKPSGMYFPFMDQGVHFPVPGETWIVCEGVKDSAALYGLDYWAAGTNGDQLPLKFAPLFRGVHVVLLPDRTPDAEAKAATSAARLSGVAASVKIATLPLPIDGSKGDDTRDALKQPNGEQMVRDAIDNAQPWGETKDSKALGFIRRKADQGDREAIHFLSRVV